MTFPHPSPFPPTWASAWGIDRLSPFPFAELELTAGVVVKLRWIPPGRFLMGSPETEAGRTDDEGPQHWVQLTRGFWLAEAPCTQLEWEAVMGENPSYFMGVDFPVEQVSWEDCQRFCARLDARNNGLVARLPTEAEWEWACRGDTTTAFNDGSDCTEPTGKDLALARLGWFSANSGGHSHEVKQLKANAWGIFDMHGNVWEWCQDWYAYFGLEEVRDPSGPDSGQGRAMRGGGWDFFARVCRSARRSACSPAFRWYVLGFRLAVEQTVT